MSALVIYPEDSGKDAEDVLRALVKLLTRALAPDHRHDKLKVNVANGEPRSAMRAHRWASPKEEGLRRALVRDLATRLRSGELIVFHHDGDEAWRGKPGSAKHDKAVEGLLRDVRRALNTGEPDTAPVPGFLRLVPHYSVEAWLYLNHAEVQRLAPERAARWLAAERRPGHGLDHLHKPKDDEAGKGLSDKHNRALAQSLRVEDLQESPSARAIVEAWRGCTPLMTALSAASP
ncbi:MAG: hypothetical protein IPN01_25175 [Deltaproteobacteria bacterium]|nr:hypothetical protein [Deltaproteobacteria bacterium]